MCIGMACVTDLLTKHTEKRKQPGTSLDCFPYSLGNKKVAFFYKILSCINGLFTLLICYEMGFYNIGIHN